MSWSKIRGHRTIIESFRRLIAKDRLPHAYLFVGAVGVGKRLVANQLAASLLCEQEESGFEPCGECSACRQVAAETHPDFLTVCKPAEKNFIPLELFIGDSDHRARQGLCHDIALKPFRGGRKIAIIDDADFLNQEGANCLLKTLEEPPPDSLIILISSSEHRQLPTIRSRCQSVRFAPLASDEVEQILLGQELPEGSPSARSLSLAAGGSVSRALELANPEFAKFRQDWLRQLASHDPTGNNFYETINSFVDSAGKDGAAKRKRLRLVCDVAIDFYRQLMTALTGRSEEADESMTRAVQTSLSGWSGGAVPASECFLRCVEAHRHIDANANQQTLIECWLSDLGRIKRGELGIELV